MTPTTEHGWLKIHQIFVYCATLPKLKSTSISFAGATEVTTAAQVAARSLGWDEAKLDQSRWDGPPQVVVNTDAGELRYVEQIVADALTVLETEMSRLKI